MSRSDTHRIAEVYAQAAGLLVCAAALFVPKAALATCGDYLAMPGHESPHVTPHQTQDAPKPALPCRGPNCRRSDSPASPTAPFSLERMSDQWACAIATVDARSISSESRNPESGVHRTDGHPLSIERPPR